MSYVVNVDINDTFILRDNVNTAITGKVSSDFSTVEAYEVGDPSVTATVTLTETGLGEYRISFTPTTPTSGDNTSWAVHVVYDSGGVFREFMETYVVTSDEDTIERIINVPINDTFILRDNSNLALTGKVSADFSTVESYEIFTPSTTAAVTIYEIGAGEYRITFTPTTATAWTSHVVYNSGGVFREYIETYNVINDTSNSTGNTLRDIRAGAARKAQDWMELIATANSASVNTFFDDQALFENDSFFRGSDVWFLNNQGTAANRGRRVRVTDSDLSTTSLTLSNGLQATPVIGDKAWLFNIGGTGDRIRTYDAVINDAIRSLGSSANVVHSVELGTAWDSSSPWVDIPSIFTDVSSLQWEDESGVWNDIVSASWAVDLVNKRIAISDSYGSYAHSYKVRINGRKAHPELVDDTDTTDVDYEWLTSEVAGNLLLMKQDQLKVNLGGQRKNEAMELRAKAAPFNLMEGLIRVR